MYQILRLIFAVILTVSGAISVRSETPLVIMVGIDGLRADAIDRVDAPNLRALAARGVRSKGMIPAMPTKTFVNFYSLATGLHPEHHGFVSNYPYDRKLGESFSREKHSQDPTWWGGEPIWITAEKQGVKAGTYFWVGSEVPIDGIRPTYWKPFDWSKDYGERITEVLGWLGRPVMERPGLVTLYFSAVDTAVHNFGVGSNEERDAILKVDSHLGDLLAGLKKQGLYDRANIIVVSDHGMANLADDRLINIDKIVNLDKLTIPDWHKERGPNYSPFLNLYGEATEIARVHSLLQGAHPKMQVFKRGHFPKRYHFNHPDRAPDLMALAETGWILYASENAATPLPVKTVPWSSATHGFDNQHIKMHATFLAAGPQFKQGVSVGHFDNVEVYGLLACALGIKPTKTDGNLKNVAHFLASPCP
ncbi:MAG: alkaline phosphatase family protein [Kordiimonadaceae bacterium]|nr:alkaline phosphatase family protein [Kordiimonadaceae bacterium]